MSVLAGYLTVGINPESSPCTSADTGRLCVSDWRFTCWRLEFSSQVVPTPLRSGELRQVRARRRIPHPERCHAAGQLHLGKQNTATGKLTEKIFLPVFERAKDLLGR